VRCARLRLARSLARSGSQRAVVCNSAGRQRRGGWARRREGGSGASSEAAYRGTSAGRYLVYNPCISGSEGVDYCLGQFNNQLHMLWHAMAVAGALQRTLVLPPFMWMANQSAGEQRWFPASHFLNLCAMRRRQPVIEWDAFAALVGHTSGGALSHYLHPPYLLTADDTTAFTAAFFHRRGLSFRRRRLASPFDEVRQSASGRGSATYQPGEGRGFWAAAALHLNRQQGELRTLQQQQERRRHWRRSRRFVIEPRAGRFDQRQMHDDGVDDGGVHDGGVDDGGVDGGGEGEGEGPLVQLLMRHSLQLSQWSSLAREHPQLRGEPLLAHNTAHEEEARRHQVPPRRTPDALVLDFAPSYNFNLDCFAFDTELRAVQQAAAFAAPLLALAREAQRATLGDDERYLAAHLRRDGYEYYCFGRGLGHYGGRRFGVAVAEPMCFPSVALVGQTLRELLRRHALRHVLLATNSIDAAELRALHAEVPHVRWQPRSGIPPEWVPHVELLLCARAAAFVGTLPSTFSTSVVAQRDLLGRERNTSAFFGAPDFFAGLPWPRPVPASGSASGGWTE